MSTTVASELEVWFMRKLKALIEFTNGNDVADRRTTLRAYLLAHDLGDVTVPHTTETWAEAFERVYGQPLQ